MSIYSNKFTYVSTYSGCRFTFNKGSSVLQNCTKKKGKSKYKNCRNNSLLSVWYIQ